MSSCFSTGEVPQDEVKARFMRIYEVTGCYTQQDLAATLRLRQSSISDARRRGSMPSEWLLKLLCMYGVNPDWILSGMSPKFLVPSDKPVDMHNPHPFPPVHALNAELIATVLRCFPSRYLVNELHRRKKAGGQEEVEAEP